MTPALLGCIVLSGFCKEGAGPARRKRRARDNIPGKGPVTMQQKTTRSGVHRKAAARRTGTA